jgi:hypothetical protein
MIYLYVILSWLWLGIFTWNLTEKRMDFSSDVTDKILVLLFWPFVLSSYIGRVIGHWIG